MMPASDVSVEVSSYVSSTAGRELIFVLSVSASVSGIDEASGSAASSSVSNGALSETVSVL